MYEQVEKPKENKSRAIANSVGQKKSNEKQGFGFVDNRSETVAQRKLQEITANHFVQQQQPIPKKGNNTGLLNNLVQLIKAEELDKEKIYEYNGSSYTYSGIYTGNPARLKGKHLFTAEGETAVGKIYLDDESLKYVKIKHGEVDRSKDEGHGQMDIEERPETIASDLTDEQCQRFGKAAIQYARSVIPLAGNQKKDVDKDKQALWRSELTKNIKQEFTSYVKQRSSERLKDNFKGLPPYIRQQIIVQTQGGTCGDYAVLVYEFLRSEGKPAKIFKSSSHGEHAWVVLKSKTGTEWYIDAWPTEVRDVVREEDFFTKANNLLTSEVIDDDTYDLVEKEELNKLWAAYWADKEEKIAIDIDTIQKSGVKLEITSTVQSTRKEKTT